MQSNRRAARPLGGWWAVALSTGIGACSPVLDWREVRAPGAPVALLMPCKPGTQQRELPLAGSPVVLTLQACSAGGRTWALVSADVGDPARVEPALQALLSATASKLDAPVPAGSAFAPPGSTPNARSRRAGFAASAPDGSEVLLDTAVFALGTWVFQATVLGGKADGEAVESFFASLRAVP